MRDRPTYADAAILMTLVWGGDPEWVLGWTDHINAGYAEHGDWVHASALLGRLGLLVPGEPLPSPTQAGREIVSHYCPSGMPVRTGAKKIRDALADLPIVADPVPPPERRVIDDAIDACEQRNRRGMPKGDHEALRLGLSDAWILLALVGGKGDPERTLALADGMYAWYPAESEWAGACDKLGRLGLIEPGRPLPRPTVEGEALARRFSGDRPVSRATPTPLFLALKELPVVGEPVAPPDTALLLDTVKTLQGRLRRLVEDRSDERLPRLRDAWLLACLHRNEGIDWRSVSANEEDGPPDPTDADWHHALDVLGRRGLVTLEGGIPKPTDAGARLVGAKGVGPQSAFRLLLGILERIQRVDAERPALPLVPSDALRRLEYELGWD